MSHATWLGDIGTGGVSPTPHPTPPQTSITRDQAIARVTAEAVDFPSGATVRSVVVETETEAIPSLWPQEVDPWVWAVKFGAPDGSSGLVLLDYVTGDLIQAQWPFP